MDFRDGFDWMLVGFCIWVTGAITIPILKLFNVIKLNWWFCLSPLILFLVLIVISYALLMIEFKSLAEEFGFE